MLNNIFYPNFNRDYNFAINDYIKSKLILDLSMPFVFIIISNTF